MCGGVFFNGGAVIRNCVNRNAANGGGLTIYNGGTATIDGGIITECQKNMTNGGGGICLSNAATGSAATLIMISGEISGNRAIGSETSTYNGGGISAYGSSAITISGGKISGNRATQHGGGIYAEGALTINNSTISGNSVNGNGGGIYGAAKCTIRRSGNVIIGGTKPEDGNVAGRYGGGGILINGANTSPCSINIGEPAEISNK